jgi:hypothetical protein
MLAHDSTQRGSYFSRLGSQISAEKFPEGTLANETDTRAVFGEIRQMVFFGDLAYLALVKVADWNKVLDN